MDFKFNKYSFRGIQDLCRVHHRELYMSMDRDKLKAVLENRRVRFVSPLGYFDYVYFGEFTFDGDVMILWTKKMEYTRFHKPLHTFTLWSQVPVFFAGVDTRYKDDQNQEIFTGDVVSCKGYTSFVRYFGESTVPGLAGDNCEILFDKNGSMHKEGTVFSGISPSLFKEYHIESLYWPRGQFVPSGMNRDKVIERAVQAKIQPTFVDDFQPQRRGRQLIYQDISEVLREGDVLCYFVAELYKEEGVIKRRIYADNIPEDYKGEDYLVELTINEQIYDSIHYSFQDFLNDSIKYAFHNLLQYAHNNPEKTFVLCDFKNAGTISIYEEQKTALLFWEWYEYKIPNVILPFWILNNIVGWDMIGRD